MVRELHIQTCWQADLARVGLETPVFPFLPFPQETLRQVADHVEVLALGCVDTVLCLLGSFGVFEYQAEIIFRGDVADVEKKVPCMVY